MFILLKKQIRENLEAQGGFPLSRNFYVRAYVKFTFANEIEAMY